MRSPGATILSSTAGDPQWGRGARGDDGGGGSLLSRSRS